MDNPDYYNLLGVPRNATLATIQRAYRRLALKWHPDKNPDDRDMAEFRFKKISEAYQVLSDHLKRHRYDLYGNAGPSGEQISTFTFQNPTEVFRAFFGSSDPFSDPLRNVYAMSGGGGGYTGPTFSGNPFSQQQPSMGSQFKMNIESLTIQAPFPVPWETPLEDISQLYRNNWPPPPAKTVTEATTVRYVDGKWAQTCTVTREGETIVIYQDGKLVSNSPEPQVDLQLDDVEDMEIDQ